jgi:hypothetical protein
MQEERTHRILELPLADRPLDEFEPEELPNVEPALNAVAHESASQREPPRRYGVMFALLLAAAGVAGFLLSANYFQRTPDADESAKSAPRIESPPAEPTPTAAAISDLAQASTSKIPAEPAERATRTAVSPPNPALHEDAENLSGWWTISNRVEPTSSGAFDTLNLGYRVRLQQSGNHISGTGHKWMEDGRPLAASRRTSIALEGTRNGRQLELTYTETGASRVSQGTFVMELTTDGALQGTFLSDAANSQGSSLAKRVPPPPD